MWVQWNAVYTYIIVWRWCGTAAYNPSLWVRAHGGCCGLGNDWVQLKKIKKKGQSFYWEKNLLITSLLGSAINLSKALHLDWQSPNHSYSTTPLGFLPQKTIDWIWDSNMYSFHQVFLNPWNNSVMKNSKIYIRCSFNKKAFTHNCFDNVADCSI